MSFWTDRTPWLTRADQGSLVQVERYDGSPGRPVVGPSGKAVEARDGGYHYHTRKGKVECYCWCEHLTLWVPARWPAEGKTLSCGRWECDEDGSYGLDPVVASKRFDRDAMVDAICRVMVGVSKGKVMEAYGISARTLRYWMNPAVGDSEAQYVLHLARKRAYQVGKYLGMKGAAVNLRMERTR